MSYTSARAVGRETSTSPDFITGGRVGLHDGPLIVPAPSATIDVRELSGITAGLSADIGIPFSIACGLGRCPDWARRLSNADNVTVARTAQPTLFLSAHRNLGPPPIPTLHDTMAKGASKSARATRGWIPSGAPPEMEMRVVSAWETIGGYSHLHGPSGCTVLNIAVRRIRVQL